MPFSLGERTGVFNWLYRRLGTRYPATFLIVELQSAYLVTIGAIVLLSQFYDVTSREVFELCLIVLAINVVAIWGGILHGRHRIDPIREWIAGRRDPEASVEAWRATVSLPLDVLRRDMPIPVFVLVVPTAAIAVVKFGLPWTAFLPIVASGLIAVGYASILHYFAIETGMRPVLVDMSESLPPAFEVGYARVPLALKLMGSLPLINIITGLTVAALTNEGEGGASLAFSVLVAVAVASTISFELTVLLTKSILRPIKDLNRATERIAAGDYEVQIPITTGDEMGELAASFNQMAVGLAERERLREAFGTYLDHEVAAYILASPEIPRGVQVDVSILFLDVCDFTPFAAAHEPHEVVATLNRLFETIVPVVQRHGGHVDKFVGDGLLAVFGAPEQQPDHADRAVAAALEIAAIQQAGGLDPLRVGIGVNSGEVLAGSIGGAGRLNFSIIGDAVNVAARVERATRETGDTVLITAATRDRLRRPVELQSRGDFTLKGIEQPVALLAAPVSAATPA